MDRQWQMTTRAATLLVAVALITSSASAETLFTATLDGSQNVPPTGSTATGTAALILNDEETEVAYTVTYEGLEGDETAAHFHQAPPGENGSVLYTLPLGTPKIGVWRVTAHDVGYLFAGEVYVNIHTTAYLGGEIRGNISESAADVSDELLALTWSRIKALYQ